VNAGAQREPRFNERTMPTNYSKLDASGLTSALHAEMLDELRASAPGLFLNGRADRTAELWRDSIQQLVDGGERDPANIKILAVLSIPL
jgi:hypothetical protein